MIINLPNLSMFYALDNKYNIIDNKYIYFIYYTIIYSFNH